MEEINQPTNQPINQSTNQPINQSTNQPINQSTNQPKAVKIPIAEISLFLARNNLRGLEMISLSGQVHKILNQCLAELKKEKNLIGLVYVTKCYDLTLKKFEGVDTDELVESGIDNLLQEMMRKADQKTRFTFLYLLENETKIKSLIN